MSWLLDLANSLAGLLVGLGAFFTGLAGMITAFKRPNLFGKGPSNAIHEDSEPPNGRPSRRNSLWIRRLGPGAWVVAVTSCVVSVLGVGILAARTVAPGEQSAWTGASQESTATAEPRSLNEELIRKAWAAFEAKEWSEAIETSEEVIDNFAPKAKEEQRELELSRAPEPFEGQIPRGLSEREREESMRPIFDRGLLNDVATAYWIKGRAAEQLGKIEEARSGYREAARLTYARVYDPQGDSFWSPAEDARARLASLRP